MKGRTVKELIEICKYNYIDGYSKLKKEELIEHMRVELAEREYKTLMRSLFKKADGELEKGKLALKYYRALDHKLNINLKLKEIGTTGTREYEGTFIRKGFNSFQYKESFLLINVTRTETSEEVANSLWFTITEHTDLKGIKNGDKVKFMARVKYLKFPILSRSTKKYFFRNYRLGEVREFGLSETGGKSEQNR